MSSVKQEEKASSPEQAPEQTGQSATEQTDSSTDVVLIETAASNDGRSSSRVK